MTLQIVWVGSNRQRIMYFIYLKIIIFTIGTIFVLYEIISHQKQNELNKRMKYQKFLLLILFLILLVDNITKLY